MTLRVLLADDELLARKRLLRLLEEQPDVEVTAVCDSAEAALAALPTARPDVLVLDLSMPGLGGLELGRRLAGAGPALLFVTAHSEHAVEAFELGVVDYIVKPVTGARLAQALARLRRARPSPAARIPIETRNGLELVDPETLVYAHFDGALVTLVGLAGTWITAASLKDLEALLPPTFQRVDRRHLLNLDQVTRLEPEPDGGAIALTRSGARVPVSRQAARALRRRLGL